MRLFFPLGFVVLAGLAALSSISTHLFTLQLIWVAVGGALIWGIRYVDWEAFVGSAWIVWGVYAASVLLLVAAYVTAPEIRNTRSWIVLGPVRFQPVELAKIALILVYAQYFSKRHISIARLKYIAASFILFALPAGLTMLQPDLGSVIVLFGIWFGFLLVSGLPRRWVVAAFVLFAVVGAVGWSTVLEDYQRERIVGVFYLEEHSLTTNYSTIQSKIAVGSAGWFGKGYGQGTQTQLGFLPEPATDFIFSAFTEEWGVVAGVLVIVAFAALVSRVLAAGIRADTNFETFICIGVALVFGIHFIINTGSALGLLPVVGIPFPFMSYGGSSMVTGATLIGFVYAIDRET